MVISLVILRIMLYSCLLVCILMRQTRYTWFIISSILGLLFLLWGALTPSRPLLPGEDSWLVLPGLLMFFIGIFGSFEILLSARAQKHSPAVEESPDASGVSAVADNDGNDTSSADSTFPGSVPP